MPSGEAGHVTAISDMLKDCRRHPLQRGHIPAPEPRGATNQIPGKELQFSCCRNRDTLLLSPKSPEPALPPPSSINHSLATPARFDCESMPLLTRTSMKTNTPTHLATGLIALIAATTSHATVLSGSGGSGVPAGQSSLIGVYDYTDTFTGFADGASNAARVYVAAVQPAAAYAVENTHGHPSVNFRSQSVGAGIGEFSFAADGAGTPGLVNGVPAYPGSSGAGSATGFTQTGGGVDYGVPYGFRSQYVVQFDAVASGDRMDITTGAIAGTISNPGNLSVFIRGDGTGNVSLYNGSVDTPAGFATELANDGRWHNYAVLFDQDAQRIEIFIDEESKGAIDLTTFAGGLYAGFSNAAVGVGLGLPGTQNRSWTDNFQVGAPIPEPLSAWLVLGGLAAVGMLRRKR